MAAEGGGNLPEFTVKINREAKLKELLRSLASPELQLCSDACKEFIRILKSEDGPEFVRSYVETSVKLVEISQVWEFRKGKPGFLHIMNLIAGILKHWNDNVVSDGGFSIGQALDKFARSLVEEKMGDLYKELNSKEAKRQNAVLLLLSSIVRRNSHLAWDVAKNFDFKLPVFPKLAEVRLRARKILESRKKIYSTRKAFVHFAMAFLEVGNPRLLRGVLQNKEMYLGVLRGLGNDDEETAVYILSVLRDRVLAPESLVPTGLRSVLFGSVMLEQLASISGKGDFGDVMELANKVLVMVCTDPVNGLMPGLDRQPSPLRGNPKRLLGFMKKLRATEVAYHKSLLLAIVKGQASFGSVYLDEFPYNIEDLASDNWFAAISLASYVISAVTDGLSIGTANNAPAFDSQFMQEILKCLRPRPFTRLVINKGLLHSDPLVKHGTLKLVLEVLKLLDYLLKMIDISSQPNNQMVNKWEALKAEIQNEVRMLLPDPQVLLSLLSPLNSYFKNLESTVKRKAKSEPEHHSNVSKRLKTSDSNEDLDIVISGVNPLEVDLSGDGEVANSGDDPQLEKEDDMLESIRELWGLHQFSMMLKNFEDVDTCFYSKILDTLQILYRTIPMAIEGLFDLFKFLPNNPQALPTILQQSLLELLNEHVNQFSMDLTPYRTPPQMYKHLYPFLMLLISSPVIKIKEQAYALARAAMLSTGAFDNSTKEICAWFFFIPGYVGTHVCLEEQDIEIIQNLSSVIISFLCDAVSTTGNNLYRYMGLLKHYMCKAEAGKDLCLDLSPFIICILEKCLRLLNSDSGSFTIPQKTLISLYVCNTIKQILDTQVNVGALPYLVNRILSEKLEDCGSKVDVLELVECACEWRPLKALLGFTSDMLQQQYYSIYFNVDAVLHSNNCFVDTLHNIIGVLRTEHDTGFAGLALGFCFSLVCTQHTELLLNFPLVLSISSYLHEVPFLVLSSIFFLEPNYLTDVLKLWPEMFFAALDSVIHCQEKKGEMSFEADLESKESALYAFASFLRNAPFHVLFSSIMQSTHLHLYEQSGLLKLLSEKVSEMPYDHLVSSLCNVLFWITQTRSCYRVGHLDGLEMLLETCFKLADQLLKRILVQNIETCCPAYVKALPPLHYAVEVVEIIFNHPAVTSLLDCPLSCNKELPDSVFGKSGDALLESAKQVVHSIDHCALTLVRTVSELVSAISDDQTTEHITNGRKRMSKAFKAIEQKLLMEFKNKFDACIESMDFKPLLPMFFVLSTWVHFISPFEQLDLVNWVFSRIGFNSPALLTASETNGHCIALHLASFIFYSLSSYMGSHTGTEMCVVFGGTDEIHVDLVLFEKIFFQVIEICNQFKLHIADTCLLKAVKVMKIPKAIQFTHLPSTAVLSRVVACTPTNIVSYCLDGINMTKAELLYHITAMSMLHMSFFGFMFSERVCNLNFHNANGTEEACKFSDEELVMLLPTVILYLNSVAFKFGGQCKHSESIISIYGPVLLDGFHKWKVFVSGSLFEVGLDGPLTSSAKDFLNCFSDSLLGKAVVMAQHYLESRENTLKVGSSLSLFKSVCPSSTDNIFDHVCGESGLHALKQPLDFANKAVAKINLCRFILFSQPHPQNGEKEAIPTSRLEKSRIRFFRMLINSWILIVKNSSECLDYFGNSDGESLSLDRFLEVFVINNISELTAEMHDSLVELDSLPFIEQFFKLFLLHRFGDPVTTRMLRTVLACLSDGKFSCVSLIQLLLAHSQFAQTIHLACQSHLSTQLGLVFTPMQSILRSATFPHVDLNKDSNNMKLKSLQCLNLLELIKLVRVLFHICAQQREVDSGDDTDINSRELVFLLLSSYGAMCTEIDREIYDLLMEIESNYKSCAGSVVKMDYLWGFACLKMRKIWDQNMQSAEPKKMEFPEVQQKIIFRENLPVDPKFCAQTVLYFPYNRSVNGRYLYELQMDNSTVMHEASSTTSMLPVYDPSFILRFSIHCLSTCYVEPIEFARLGLLAVTFVSISSPDDDLRKLGYETLSILKSALEKCQKKKDVSQLRLLLSYLQNGIEEPWQRIPSVIAVFVAEASLVLLDPSHENYSAITKHLMSSPSANMKVVPLFQAFFWSSSITFKTERLWMLRLLYAGLNTEDDAQAYIRNSIFQNIMNLYSSPLSDNDSKELTIQIIKKAVRLRKSVWFLVERCGLISWLSSIVSSLHGSDYRGHKKFTFAQLPSILEVMNYITAPRSMIEWLQKNAMEQLSELSLHLYELLVDGFVLADKESILCRSILQILSLLLKTSQKRKVYQPHFTLSKEGLFRLYKAVDAVPKTTCDSNAVLLLKAVLMSTPVTLLHTDQEELSKFLRWAVITAVQSTSAKAIQPEDSANHSKAFLGKKSLEDSLVLKLLRWLTASVILGKISCKAQRCNSGPLAERSSLEILRSSLGCDEKQSPKSAGYGCEHELAESIFFLLQQLEFSHESLPSAVSALCLLLSYSFSELESPASTGISLQQLCSKIRCPSEANPAWRWAYYQPWRDLSFKLNDMERVNEIHACESLLMLASHALQNKSGCCHGFDPVNNEMLHVYQWERSLLDSST